jgi:hypothetical protein
LTLTGLPCISVAAKGVISRHWAQDISLARGLTGFDSDRHKIHLRSFALAVEGGPTVADFVIR